MGTNYYRIPTVEEVEARRVKLLKRVEQLDSMNAAEVESEFRIIQKGDWERHNPWEEFTDEMSIHLGKRSGGWKFLWNFHDNRYYSNKEELFKFIRSGRIVNEYGEQLNPDEFIQMALTWGQADGLVFDKTYEDKMAIENPNYWRFGRQHYDREVDGLRISSAIDFC